MADCDVLVVGGGIHGCGVAQAAAAAGYRTLLVEQTALAHGTSSRSSKLIHGGLRYLEQWELGLVRECLRERRLLLELAPELVTLRPFHIPVFTSTSRPAWQVRLGLMLYAALAGFRRNARFRSLPREQWATLDGLETDGLVRVFCYHDAQTDDRRLTRAVMASARQLGAELDCPARLVGARLTERGIEASVESRGRARPVRARVMVNAAGPWANEVLERVRPSPPIRPVELVRGSHALIEGGLEQGIYYVESPRDRRPVFVMPWGEHTLVGTTEQRFRGSPDHVEPSAEEIGYLENAFRHYFPQRPWRELDRFAGLRVLPPGETSANRRTRETVLRADRGSRPRLLTVYGGKLTSYRATAERVMQRLAGSLPRRPRRARTDEIRLEPADEGDL